LEPIDCNTSGGVYSTDLEVVILDTAGLHKSWSAPVGTLGTRPAVSGRGFLKPRQESRGTAQWHTARHSSIMALSCLDNVE